jgi:hypothetical protein
VISVCLVGRAESEIISYALILAVLDRRGCLPCATMFSHISRDNSRERTYRWSGVAALGGSATQKLAVEAVIGEPVSAGEFPVKREITGNPRWFRLRNAGSVRFPPHKSDGYGRIP